MHRYMQGLLESRQNQPLPYLSDACRVARIDGSSWAIYSCLDVEIGIRITEFRDERSPEDGLEYSFHFVQAARITALMPFDFENARKDPIMPYTNSSTRKLISPMRRPS